MKKINQLKSIFFALVVIFVLILGYFFAVPMSEKRGFFPFAVVLAFVFFSLGGILIFLTFRFKVKGGLKKFLILTGISSAGFLVSVILHNFFYALAVITSHISILNYLMEVLHVVFFLIAIPVCPILFLVGIIGGVVIFLRKKKL